MPLQLEKAQKILLDAVRVMPAEAVPLEASWQRVLAETIIADTDFPPFDRSPLDGYAVIAAEIENASPERPVRLRVIDNIPAGSLPRATVVTGTAARLMTGAPVPSGATGVVRLEDTREGGESVALFSGVGTDKNICRRGEEITAGEAVIMPGTVINAGVMGMLALLGYSRPSVYRRPRVALLATGSELVPVDRPLAPGVIRNSNSYMLSAQVSEAGADPVLYGTVQDEVGAIAKRINEAVDCDVVITTGGVSKGDYDLVSEVYRHLGITIFFERLSIKPGMPLVAGVRGDMLFLGLSGNPAAAAVAFEQVVRPALLKMGGRAICQRAQLTARLAAAFGKSTTTRRFVWARCRQEGGDLVAVPLELQGNGMLKSAMAANALIVIPENSPPLPAGSKVAVMLTGDL